jgi:tetrahydromethanopterin S-methyltransferase subunit B
VLGFGMTVTVAPLTTTVMNALDPAHAGLASGINNAVSRAAGLLAIALLGIVMNLGFRPALEARLQTLALPPAVSAQVLAQRDRLGAIALPASRPAHEQRAVRLAVMDSFVSGFRWVMGICVLLALLASVSASGSIFLGFNQRGFERQ